LAEIKKATKTRTAELSWELVKTNGRYSLLKILPKTGRFHQIRVQMAEMQNPILGDTKYLPAGSQVANQSYSPNHRTDWQDRESIALCATDIEFKLATVDEVKKISIDLPESWQKYL